MDTDSSDTLLAGIVQVSTGNSHACALTSAGGVKCWGEGSLGRLGDDCRNTFCIFKELPIDVKSAADSSANLSGIVQISAGGKNTCALTTTGGVKCWGDGSLGVLGNGDTTNKSAPVDVLTSADDSTPLSGIVQISVNGSNACALTGEGGVKCWGANDTGQVANGAISNNEDTPVDVVISNSDPTPLSGIVQVSVGGSHVCTLTSGGNVKCWGAGGSGQLGRGSVLSANAPVTVTATGTTALTGIAGIYSGENHSCALKSGGGVVCWGEGDNGKLGNNATADQSRPVDVLTSDDGNPALSGIAQIGLGNAHSCAVTTAGAVKCWGHGDVGQLGNDATNDSNLSVDVVNEDSGSGTLNIGTTKRRYICYEDGSCALETE